MRYTIFTSTISYDNNNHRTSKHASKSWRSDGSPSCLGGSSHGWVPVKTHSTPVPTSVGRLWVAHQLHNNNSLGKMSENALSNFVWEDKLTWFEDSSQYRTLDTIDGEPMEFEWNIYPGFTTLQLLYNVQEFMSKMSIEPEDFTGRIIFLSMFNDISWGSKGKKQECELSAQLVSIYAKRFSPGRWSFLGLGSEKKWYSTLECKTTRRMGQSCRADDVKTRRKQTSSLQIHKSIVSRSAQKQRWWKIINTLLR